MSWRRQLELEDGVFQKLLDLDEEGDCLFAVDKPVVVGKGQVHHRADDDLTVLGDGAFHDSVHAEDGTLRRIGDGSGEHGAIHAAVGDGEDSTLEVFHAQAVGAGFFGEFGQFLFQLEVVFLVAVPQDGDGEALVRTDGNGDVIIVVGDDVVTVDAGIDLGDFLKCSDDGLDEKAHEAEACSGGVGHAFELAP